MKGSSPGRILGERRTRDEEEAEGVKRGPRFHAPGPSRFGLTRERGLDLAVGATVLLAYAIVQVALLPGPHPFDPVTYFKTAVRFPEGPINPFTLRIGLIAPERAAVLLFGPSEASFYAVPIASGLLLAASVYIMMLVLFRSPVLGAAAALVTVLNPNYLLNSSSTFPDVVATATFTAGFLCMVVGARNAKEGGREWAPAAFAAGAGALFGWTFLAREFSPILLPAVVAAVLLLGYSLRRVALLAGTALAVASLDLLYGFVRFEDPLKHFETLLGQRTHAARPGRQAVMDYVDRQLNDPLDTMLVLPRLFLSWSFGWLLLVLAAVFVAALLTVRDRRLWVLGAWFFSFWAVMVVAGLVTLPSGRWILNVTNIRYWYPALPPLVMGAFGGAALLLRARGPRRYVGRLVAVTAAVLSLVVVVPGTIVYDGCIGTDAWRNDPQARWDDLRSWLSTRAADRYDVIWTDKLTAGLVPAFAHTTFGRLLWPGRVETIRDPQAGIAPRSHLERSLILVHKDRLRNPVPGLEARLRELRADWLPVFVSGDGNMVLLAHSASGPAAPRAQARAWWAVPSKPAAIEGGCGMNPYRPANL